MCRPRWDHRRHDTQFLVLRLLYVWDADQPNDSSKYSTGALLVLTTPSAIAGAYSHPFVVSLLLRYLSLFDLPRDGC